MEESEFWDNMDIVMTNHAIEFANMPKEVIEKIFIIKNKTKRSIFDA